MLLVMRVTILLSRFITNIYFIGHNLNRLIKEPAEQEQAQQGVGEVPPGDEPQVENLQVGEFSILYFQLEGDDGNIELQQVIQQQLEAGQGPGMSTQEFNDLMFL